MGKGKRVLKTVAVLVLLGAAAFVVYEAFKVREINVVGANQYTADTVVALSGIEYETSVFFLDKQEAMEALAKEPYIKPISVDIKYPDKIILTIEERQPAAYIDTSGALLVIDDECWLLEAVAPPQQIPLPQVYGLQIGNVQVGQRLAANDEFKLNVLSRVLSALGVKEIEAKSVDVTLAASIVVKMPDDLIIELGDDTDLDIKLKSAASWIRESQYSGGILNVSIVATSKEVYYRPAADNGSTN